MYERSEKAGGWRVPYPRRSTAVGMSSDRTPFEHVHEAKDLAPGGGAEYGGRMNSAAVEGRVKSALSARPDDFMATSPWHECRGYYRGVALPREVAARRHPGDEDPPRRVACPRRSDDVDMGSAATVSEPGA
jgi:hypothetical protein